MTFTLDDVCLADVFKGESKAGNSFVKLTFVHASMGIFEVFVMGDDVNRVPSAWVPVCSIPSVTFNLRARVRNGYSLSVVF